MRINLGYAASAYVAACALTLSAATAETPTTGALTLTPAPARPPAALAVPLLAGADAWPADAAWAAAPAVDLIYLDGTVDAAQAPSRVRVGLYRGDLLMHFECHEPDLAHLVYACTGRDSPNLWRDDTVEVFLRTGQGDSARRLRIEANPIGAYWDAVEKADGSLDVSWDPPLRCRGAVGRDRWTVDLALPLTELAAPGTTPTCRVFFVRVRQGREGAFSEETGSGTTGGGQPETDAQFIELQLPALPPDNAAVRPPPPPDPLGRMSGAALAAALRARFGRPAVILPRDGETEPMRLEPLSTTCLESTEATVARVAHTANGLRITARCAERSMPGVVTNAAGGDERIWQDDCLELFLAPGRKESADYLHTIVNPAGAVFTSRGSRKAAFPGVTVSARREADGWLAEIDVPFGAINVATGSVPAVWGLNFMRHRAARPGAAEQTTAWSRFPWSAHNPGLFGTLWLAGGVVPPELADLQPAQPAPVAPPPPAPLAGVDPDVFAAAEREQLGLPTTVARHLAAVRDAAFAARDREWSAVKTWDDWLRLKSAIRQRFLSSIGGLPESPGSLNPRVSLAYEDEDIRVERLIIESRPNFHVTGNVFVPKRRNGQRVPVVVRVVGHSTRGRLGEPLRFCDDLARRGYLAVTIDISGQGERIYTSNGLGSRTPTSNHYAEGAGLFLTGANLAGLMIYDVIRTIDYTATREEADMSRVVLTGQSGGGTLTEYVAALEDRLAGAVPVSSGGSARKGGGNYDSEQVLLGSVPHGLDIEGFAALAAPRPYRVITEADDESRRDTEASFAIARRIFALQGAGERLEYTPTSAPHGYGPKHRDLFLDWLARNVPPNPGTPPASGSWKSAYSRRCQATQSGRAFFSRDLPGAATPFTLNLARVSLAHACDASVNSAAAAETRARSLRAALRTCLALDAAGPAEARRVDLRGTSATSGLEVTKLALETDEGVWMPALRIRKPGAPAGGRRPGLIWLCSRGKRGVTTRRAEPLRRLADAGFDILVPDVRGTGETAADPDSSFYGLDAEHEGFGLRVGRPLIGMRVHDVLCGAAFLRAQPDIAADRIFVLGDSLSGVNAPQLRQPRLATDAGIEPLEQAESLGPVLALLALAIDEKLAGGAAVGLPASYADFCRTACVMHPFAVFVPGVLKHGDVADLAAAVAPRPMVLAGSVNAFNQRLDQAGQADGAFANAVRGYRLRSAASAVTVLADGGIREAAERLAALASGRP